MQYIDTIQTDGEYIGMNERIYKLRDKIRVLDALPALENMPNGSIMGYNTAILPSKVKLIGFPFVRELGEDIDTETGFTRRFMKTLPRRIIRPDEFLSYQTTRPPMFVKPAILPDAVYIDLRAAYPSIYKNIGWGSDYARGKYWGVSDCLVYPYNPEWKAGRSFVVTGARHVQFGRYVKDGAIVTKPYKSPFSNPPLVAGVYDVLSTVARFAQYAARAIYWNVDGGIIPFKALEMVKAFALSIGLDAREKYRGDAIVLNGGYWKVGNKETVRYSESSPAHTIGGDYIPVTKDDAEWIYTRYRGIVEGNIRNGYH